MLHIFQDNEAHPLDGSDLMVAVSAGTGFNRHMKMRGTEVLLAGETDPAIAITRILAGEVLPDPCFDIMTALCKVRDLL